MAAMPAVWRVAFEQAWEAHRHGSIAVGAAVVDGAGEVVVADRSRSAESDGPPGVLVGSRLSHAEVNVLARLGHRMPADLRLLSTLQPCVLCAGAISFARMSAVEYAAADAAWAGVDAVYTAAPVLTVRAPRVTRADLGRWSVWAEALPLAGVLLRYGRNNRVGASYASANPALLDLAAELAADSDLVGLGLEAAVDRWTARLAAIAPTGAAP